MFVQIPFDADPPEMNLIKGLIFDWTVFEIIISISNHLILVLLNCQVFSREENFAFGIFSPNREI